MCEYSNGNHFEPPSIESCDEVNDMAAKIELEIEQGKRDQMSSEAVTSLAAELVHSDVEPTREDYE